MNSKSPVRAGIHDPPEGHEDPDSDVRSRRNRQTGHLLVPLYVHEVDDVEGGRLQLRQPVGNHVTALPHVEPEALQGTVEEHALSNDVDQVTADISALGVPFSMTIIMNDDTHMIDRKGHAFEHRPGRSTAAVEPMMQAPCTAACFTAKCDGHPLWYLAQPYRIYRSYRTDSDTCAIIDLHRSEPVFWSHRGAITPTCATAPVCAVTPTITVVRTWIDTIANH